MVTPDPLIIPAGRNLVHNPKPTSTSFFATNFPGTVTMTFVTDRSFSGTGSVLAVIPAGQTMYWSVALQDDTDLTSLPAGATHRGRVRISGPLPSTVIVRAHVRYSDDVLSTAVNVPTNVPGTRFEAHDFTIVGTPGKTIRSAWIYIINNSGSTQNVYLGGFDWRVNAPMDAFIHGDAGTNYSWEGTANASPSNRAQHTLTPVVGQGGQRVPSIQLLVVNRQGLPLRDITEHFIDGSVGYDLDAETWKGTCNFVLDDPHLIEVLGDEFLKPILRIEKADGSYEEAPQGVFNMQPPRERWNSGQDQWTYEGRDLLSILATWMFRGPVNAGQAVSGYLVYPGHAYHTILESILVDNVGLDPSQFSFPNLDSVTIASFSWEDSTPALTIVSDLLVSTGWQKPWVTPEGIITSAPAGVNPANVVPSLVITSGEDSVLRWPFEVEPEVGKIGNRVRAVSSMNVWVPTSKLYDPPPYHKHVKAHGGKNHGKKGGKKKKGGHTRTIDPSAYLVPDKVLINFPIDIQRVNTDPTHPLSYTRLGRWLDIPTIEIPLSADESAAIAAADQRLVEASTLPIRVRLTTEVMLRHLNEVYDLNISDSMGEPIASGQGHYWCRAWSMQLGPPWEMAHSLTRVIDFRAASFAVE